MYEPLGETNHTINTGVTNKCEDRTSKLKVTALVLILGFAIGTFVFAYKSYQLQHKQDREDVHPYNLRNIALVTDALKDYYEKGTYTSEMDNLFNGFEAHLAKVIPQGGFPADSKKAVVFDLDETLLDNYQMLKSVDFRSDVAPWNDAANAGNTPAIPRTLAFLRWLLARNVKIFFITGRRDTVITGTEQNLQFIGLLPTDYVQLVTRSPDEYTMPAAAYKAKHRGQIVQNGYDIIGCIGDQFSDCAGGDAGYIMKLPNYMYFIA